MEVPSVVLQKLICDNCEEHLSRGPVLMLDDNKNRCGRCSAPKQVALRNLPYEELAKVMLFPCRYEKEGCQEKITFEDNKDHEESCTFKPFVCPIVESGKCDWFGERHNLLKHCQEKHPKNVMENSFQLVHDITKPSIHNYLLYAFHVIFLVQTKVCVTSRKLYHSIRLIDDAKDVAKYDFTIAIENKNNKLTKRCAVAPQGYLVLQEHTSLAMGINNLLETLGDLKNTTFTVTVRSTLVTCANCKLLTKQMYVDGKNWLCETCMPVKRDCKNSGEGCTYKDINLKCQKHELFYCAYSTQCRICKTDITDMSLEEHYSQSHARICYNLDKKFSYKWHYCCLMTNIGTVVWQYMREFPDTFLFVLLTPVRSEQLYLYKCEILIRHPISHNVLRRTAEMCYKSDYDWILRIPETEIYAYLYNNTFNIKVCFSSQAIN